MRSLTRSRATGVLIIGALTIAAASAAAPGGMRGSVRVPPGSILFMSQGPNWHNDFSTPMRLYAVDARGDGKLREVLDDVGAAHWSPNGRRLAFLRKIGQSESRVRYPIGLFVVRARGGEPKLVAQFVGSLQIERDFSWSPESSRIAYETPEGIYVIGVDGRRKIPIGDGEGPVWSPDGRSIAFTRDDRAPPNGGGLYVVDADGRHPRRITSYNVGVSPLLPQSWSPDGKRIVLRCCSGFAIVDLDNNSLRTSFGGAWSNPSWAPNGKWIAFHGRDSDRGTWVMKPDWTGVRRLSRVGNGLAGPIWSPNSRTLAVQETCCTTNVADIWTISVPDGRSRRVTEGWRYEYFNDGPEWQPASLPTSKLPGRYVPSSIPTDSVAEGMLLKTTRPITQLAADGDSVALGHNPCRTSDVWRPLQRSIIRFPECGGPVALAGERVVWTFGPVVWGDGERWFVNTSTFTRPRANSPERQWGTGRPLSAPVGDGSLVAFSLWGPCNFARNECTRDSKRPGELYRLDGETVVRIATSANALTPISVDGGRILVDHEDGSLELLRPDGTLIRSFSLNVAVVRGIRLQASDLVVLTTSAVEITDAQTGEFVRRWKLPVANARLEDVQNGVAVFVAGNEIVLLRLGDGSTAVIEAPSSRNVLAQLEPSGLFYSYRTDDPKYPGRVVFTPFTDLPFQ